MSRSCSTPPVERELQSSFFGYAEPSLRFPIVLAIVAEALVLPVLALLLVRSPAAVAPAGS